MGAARRPWTVTPHSPIQELTENLWLVESRVPGVPIGRRMAIVKLSDARLLFFHPVPLEDAALEKVRAWGTPAFLVVSHNQHGIDGDAFQKKLGVKLFGPREDEPKMREKFDLDGTLEALPADPAYSWRSVSGVVHGEPVILVNSASGVSAVFSDAYMNLRDGGLLMKLSGFAGADKCPPFFRWRFVNDKGALKRFFEELAAVPRLRHLIPCHGDIRSTEAPETLRKIAAGL